MRTGGGKSKGSSFEREVAVGLSRWISNGERDDLLWRSSQSGGRATTARKSNKALKTCAGDLSAIHPLGQPFLDSFYTELKAYRDLQYASILTDTGHLVNFWKSTIKEAASYGRKPMLIAKQNHKPTLVCLSLSGMEALGLIESQCVLIAPQISMHCFLFDTFIKFAKPI
jgi:hypothetical protein